MNDSQSFQIGRGSDYCRGCLDVNLFSALDLGHLPIANELLNESKELIEKFPLHLQICSSCGLGQVADVVTPERIFRDYRYLSSMSTTFLEHASSFVVDIIESGRVVTGDWVLEIASNDGYLLKNFIPFGIKVLGVEPAENVAKTSRGLGIETISEFFDSKLATELLRKHGFPRLIIANNVMAHVPDIRDFLKGLAILCGPMTEISIENPSILNILNELQFDTIYHEHYSYLTASAVSKLSLNNGLILFDVQPIPIHGGSIRYWLRKNGVGSFANTSVNDMISNEISKGLFDKKSWNDYSNKVNMILEGFSNWLTECNNLGQNVFGYGAAAKASTIMNSIRIDSNPLIAIADISLEKQGRFMPPHGIEIISLEVLKNSNPANIVIFPWNIKTEISRELRASLGPQVKLWCVIPKMHEVN